MKEKKGRSMIATTDQNARMFSLITGVSEMFRDGTRNPAEVLDVLQVVKDHADFAVRLHLKPPLLEMLGTVAFPGSRRRFSAAEKFIVNTAPDAHVKISGLSNNFTTWFLKKVEKSMSATALRYAKLLRSEVDDQIRAEIGPQFEQTTLAEIYWLMEQQPNGESGTPLLNDGRANIFYVLDVNNVLRAVGVSWRGGGWDVYASPVERPYGWFDGRQVFSRNS